VIVRGGQSYGVSVYDPTVKRKGWVGTFATLSEARAAEREAARRAPQGQPKRAAASPTDALTTTRRAAYRP
jgi:hypothetical protein